MVYPTASTNWDNLLNTLPQFQEPQVPLNPFRMQLSPDWRAQIFRTGVAVEDVNVGDAVIQMDTEHPKKVERKVASNFGEYLKNKGVL